MAQRTIRTGQPPAIDWQTEAVFRLYRAVVKQAHHDANYGREGRPPRARGSASHATPTQRDIAEAAHFLAWLREEWTP